MSFQKYQLYGDFNPHSLHREWHFLPVYLRICYIFQSTLSTQRVTKFSGGVKQYIISIHTLYTESDIWQNKKGEKIHISIHTLYTESDSIFTISFPAALYFNPHSLHREWQEIESLTIKPYAISIHTLYTESDFDALGLYYLEKWFQSTLSTQRVTQAPVPAPVQPEFQSTLSTQRVTPLFIDIGLVAYHFNPHSLHREWRCQDCSAGGGCRFQSTLSTQRVTPHGAWV